MALSSHRKWVLRQGGRPANEIRVDFEILKLLYRLNYAEFYFVLISLLFYCSIRTAFSRLSFVKLKFILRCVLKCEKFGSHFFHVNPYY